MGVLEGDFSAASKYLPDFSGIGSSVMTIGIVFVIALCLIAFGYYYWDKRRYKYKIEIYENLGGTRYVKTGIDLARIQKVGDQGEEILVLKKRKKIVTSYNRKMGDNLIWFAVGQDGYWYNVTLGDLDSKQGMLDIEPIDRDMRYSHTAIRKNYNDRYNKPKFMDKYGSIIMLGIFLIIIIIGVGYLINRLAGVATSLNQPIQTLTELTKLNKEIITGLDNVCSGSGIKAT